MVNNYYQKHQEQLPKKNEKHIKNIKIFLKKKKNKGEKRLEKDIKIFLKKKKSISII